MNETRFESHYVCALNGASIDMPIDRYASPKMFEKYFIPTGVVCACVRIICMHWHDATRHSMQVKSPAMAVNSSRPGRSLHSTLRALSTGFYDWISPRSAPAWKIFRKNPPLPFKKICQRGLQRGCAHGSMRTSPGDPGGEFTSRDNMQFPPTGHIVCLVLPVVQPPEQCCQP